MEILLGKFFYWVVGTWGGVILTIWIFSKLKTTFYKYWTTWIKIKVTMTCVYKEHKVKTKMVKEQWLQLKWSFYWAIFTGFFIGLLFSGGNWALVGGSQLGVDFSRWGNEQIFSWQGRGTPPSPSRENPDQFWQQYWNIVYNITNQY